jgi:AraC-like DNA-binding protein
MPRDLAISVRALASLPPLLKELRLELATVFEAANVPLALLQDTTAVISYGELVALLETIASMASRPQIGLLLGSRLQLDALGPLGTLALSTNTFREALKELNKHLIVHVRGITRELYQEGDIAQLVTHYEHEDFTLSPLILQMSVSTTWHICRLAAGDKWHPRSIHLAFRKPPCSHLYERFFRIPVVFDSDFSGIVFDAKDLDLPMERPDPQLFQQMSDYVAELEAEEQLDLITDIERLIRRNLERGRVGIHTVTAYLPYEHRTLQRNLKELNTSYQALLEKVRFERAKHYLLESDMPMSRIADLLCYESSSVFSRTFRSRFQQSPKAWRAKHAIKP